MKKPERKVPTKGETNDVKTRQQNPPAAVSFKIARFACRKHKTADDTKRRCQFVMDVASGRSVDDGIRTESRRLIQSANDKIKVKLSRALQLCVLDHNRLPEIAEKIDPHLEQMKARAHYMRRYHKKMVVLYDQMPQQAKESPNRNL